MHHQEEDPLLSTEEVARMLGVTTSAVRKHRARGTGPRYTTAGQINVYRLSDVQAWMRLNGR